MTRNQVEDMKEIINHTSPWDLLKEYLFGQHTNEVFKRIIECGSFWLEMKRGELHWQFFMPSTYETLSAVPHDLSFAWDCEKYIKEISFRREDLADIEIFFSALQKEMPEYMFSQFSRDMIEEDE